MKLLLLLQLFIQSPPPILRERKRKRVFAKLIGSMIKKEASHSAGQRQWGEERLHAGAGVKIDT